MKIIDWLIRHHELSSWIQAIGVVVAMAFGVVQLVLGRRALQHSVKTNEITLKNTASDLLVGINNAAMSNSDAAGEFKGHKRLHLMRIHYFYRAFELRREGLLDDDSFEAEEGYLRATGEMLDFKDVWGKFRLTYKSRFRNWVDTVLQYTPNEVNQPKSISEQV
jgi:hypothetical protein